MLKRNVADNILSSGHGGGGGGGGDESRLSGAGEALAQAGQAGGGGGDDRLSFRVSDRGLDFGWIE